MGKMSELSLVVTELRTAAKSLIGVADSLTDLSSGSGGIKPAGQQKAATTPAKEKSLTIETVRAVLAEKSRSGYTAEIRALLEKHGAAKLSKSISKVSMLLAEAEVLGNG